MSMDAIKIKNPALIKLRSSNPADNSEVYFVKKGVNHLREVIDELPNGIINKTKTGVGGTTLEIKTNRHSIIVQPLKVTASEKAFKTPNSLYVGSKTPHFDRCTDQDIKDYLLDHTKMPKKIFCVANSLDRVVSLIPKESIDDFFLLIDESDSVQKDSGFRKVMESVMKTYKMFNPSNRAMISATPLKMHDPELLMERKTIFEFEDAKKYEIVIEQTANIAGNLIDAILRIHSANPEAKIVVAYSNVKALVIVANYLAGSCKYKKEDITILCGEQSKALVKGYPTEFKFGKLQTRITLKTSAYYTGFDIDENYHLITMVDNTDDINSPSVERLIQIAGRCRKTLDSFSIIQVFDEAHYDDPLILGEILEEAEEHKAKLSCLARKKSKNPKKVLQGCDAYSRENSIEGYNLVHMHFDGITICPEISYLSIDGLMSIQNTRETVYASPDGLAKHLAADGHHVIVKSFNSTRKVRGLRTIKKLKEIEKQLMKEAIVLLKTSLSRVQEAYLNSTSRIENLVFRIFLNNKGRMNFDQLIEMIEEATLKENYENRLNHLERSLDLYFLFKDKPFEEIKTALFPIGSRIHDDEIDEKVNLLLDSCDLEALSNSLSGFQGKGILDCILELESVRFNSLRKSKGARSYFKVKSYDPFPQPIKKKVFSSAEFY